mmetsp:Transcript_86348/g.243347  ORF Transcript_86348/g.243347 Transcript_86348/m.243347 type:complete len:259 (+) Transcript_86348:686-1462(+)
MSLLQGRQHPPAELLKDPEAVALVGLRTEGAGRDVGQGPSEAIDRHRAALALLLRGAGLLAGGAAAEAAAGTAAPRHARLGSLGGVGVLDLHRLHEDQVGVHPRHRRLLEDPQRQLPQERGGAGDREAQRAAGPRLGDRGHAAPVRRVAAAAAAAVRNAAAPPALLGDEGQTVGTVAAQDAAISEEAVELERAEVRPVQRVAQRRVVAEDMGDDPPGGLWQRRHSDLRCASTCHGSSSGICPKLERHAALARRRRLGA